MGSNPTQGMHVWCMYAFICVCVVLCLGNGLAMGLSLIQGVKNNYGTELEALALNGLEEPLEKL
jgi:hypothetical protein